VTFVLTADSVQGMATKKKPAKKPKAKPVGRPPLGKDTVRINFKLPLAVRDRWIRAADKDEMTLSEWLRAAAELAFARGSTR
jgi:hypothetical protein